MHVTHADASLYVLVAETLEKLRLGTANAMKRPEVIGKVRANHLPAMHSEESKVSKHDYCECRLDLFTSFLFQPMDNLLKLTSSHVLIIKDCHTQDSVMSPMTLSLQHECPEIKPTCIKSSHIKRPYIEHPYIKRLPCLFAQAKISAAVNAAFKRKQQRRLAEEAANPEATRIAKEAKEAARQEKLAAKKAAQAIAAQERAAKSKMET